jgi:hypothetical protein
MTSSTHCPGLEDQALEFPQLHTLCLIMRTGTRNTVLRAVTEWKLPRLSFLHVDLLLDELSTEVFILVLSTHGLTLSTLIIEGSTNGYSDAGVSPRSVASAICTHCPALRDLSLSINLLPSIDIHLPTPPHLSRITNHDFGKRLDAPACKFAVDLPLRIVTKPCLIRFPEATLDSLWFGVDDSKISEWN